MYAHERETVFFFEMVTVVYGGNVQRSATKQLASSRERDGILLSKGR